MRFFRRRPTTAPNLDQQLVFQLSKSRIPSPRQLKYVGRFLNPTERWSLYTCLIVMVLSLGFMGTKLYREHVELVPRAGGRYTEGAIGNPQYINPLYASLNDADADLERLIYSRLFITDGAGQLRNDLAESYELSPDQKTYTIHLKTARFTSGDPLTADDVIFTFNLIEDAEYKSPLRDRFSGVTIQKIDDATVAFNLKEQYGRFPQLLDFGIMPASLWEGVAPETIPLAELNLKPIGSGPYRLESLVKSKTGTIRSYLLERNPDYYGNAPYLDEVVFKYFPSAEEMIAALNNGQLNGITVLPDEAASSIIAKKSLDYHQLPRPNLTAIFFNVKSKGTIGDVNVRRALSVIDRDALVAAATGGRAVTTTSLFLPRQPELGNLPLPTLEQTRAELEKLGWTKRAISDSDIAAAAATPSPENANFARLGSGEWYLKGKEALIIKLTAPQSLKAAAEGIAAAWKSIGVKAELQILPDETVQNETIAKKSYDVLVYTEALNDDDPFPFWHSSSLANLSSYTRGDVDTWLEEARLNSDPVLQSDRYNKFNAALAQDVPVVPLYWQAYLYPQNKKLKGFAPSFLRQPADRLFSIGSWYLKTERRFHK